MPKSVAPVEGGPHPRLDARVRLRLGTLRVLGVDHVVLVPCPARLRPGGIAGRRRLGARGGAGGAPIEGLSHLVRGLLQPLECTLEQLRVARVAVVLHRLLGLLERRLELAPVPLGDLVAVLVEVLLHLERQRLELVARLDRLASLLVFRLVLLRVLHHPLDVGLRHPRGSGDGDVLRLAGRLVLGRNVDDAIGVDVEGHLDLRHTARRRGDPVEAELAQQPVVTGHRALALEHLHLDRALVVGRRGEGLALLGRDGGVARDERGHHAAQRLDPQRQRRDVEEQHVFHVARQDARLHRRSERDDLVGVDALVGVLAEEVLHQLLHHRDAGRAADQHDLRDLRGLLPSVGQRLLGRLDRPLDQVSHHLFQFRAGELDLHVLRPARVGREKREVDLRLRHRRQLDLRLLGRLTQTLDHHLVLGDVDSLVLLELGDEPVHDHVVDVVAAEVRVAVGRDDLDDLLAHLEDRDVERAAAEVVDGDQVVLALVEPVGERGRRRLVDDALDLEAGDAAGILRRLALRVVEVGRDGDDRLRHLLAQVVLGRLLELHEDAGRDLRRGQLLAADLDVGLVVGDDRRILAIHDGHDGVGGAEVDADDFTHELISFFRFRFGDLACDFAVTVNTPDLASSESHGRLAKTIYNCTPEQMFHPLVQTWLERKFGAATPAQSAAWPLIAAGQDVLVTAPTGSGKTLAAFLWALDGLVGEAVAAGGALPDRTSVLYVSPLKALSNDVRRNLEEPLGEIKALAAELGVPAPEIRTAVRTGDTTTRERREATRRPPHVLVTTPESLFILLTSESGRRALRDVRTVIVDEIHAVAPDKRGAHLALSLERLEALVAPARLQRVGLSATVRPLEVASRLLVGASRPPPALVDVGQRRDLDLGVEVPEDELGAVATNEQWVELYDRIAALARAHKSTLVFVNTRRLVERVTLHLSERLDADTVAAHHGSLSRERRHRAERLLKSGELKVVVATA